MTPTAGSNFSRYVIPDDLDPPGICCVCVPVPDDRQWRATFFGALKRLTLQTNWERDAAHNAQTVAAKWLEIFIEAENMGCGCANATTINIDLAAKRVQNIIQALAWKQIWLDNSSTVSLAYYEIPDTYSTDAADAGDEIAQREEALCLAVQGWVHEVMNYMETWMISNFEEALVGLGAAAGAIGAFTGFAMWPIVIALSIPAAFVVQIFIEIRRTEYREYIICRMYDNLVGEDPDVRADFEAALTADPNPRPTPQTPHQDVARDLIESYMRSQLNNLDNYLMFAGQLGAAMDVARAGASTCPCRGEWEHTFLAGFGLQTIDQLDVDCGTSTYDAVDDWLEGLCCDASQGALLTEDQLVFASRVITRVRMYVDYISTRSTASDKLTIWDGNSGDTILKQDGVSGTNDVIVDTGVISVTTTKLTMETVVAINNTACPDNSGGKDNVWKIVINGEGVDPFL